MRISAAALLVGLVCTAPAGACTLCNSDMAERVRAGVFAPGVFTRVGQALLPFAVVAAIAAGVHGRGR